MSDPEAVDSPAAGAAAATTSRSAAAKPWDNRSLDTTPRFKFKNLMDIPAVILAIYAHLGLPLRWLLTRKSRGRRLLQHLEGAAALAYDDQKEAAWRAMYPACYDVLQDTVYQLLDN